MLDFKVDEKTCTGCGLCAADCPAAIIRMDGKLPVIAAEDEARCYRCQHCLAVCPTAAVSIFGKDPFRSQLLAGKWPLPDQMETLIRGRRTVRSYKDEDLAPELITRLIDTAAHAPTGRNAHQVCFTVIDQRKVMSAFRTRMMNALGKVMREGHIPEERKSFPFIIEQWETRGKDTILRGAPHLLVTSSPATAATPEADGFIAMTYFELLAASHGLGTVWAGLLKWVLSDIVPELRADLGIPEGNVIGYCLLFGRPAVRYARTVQRHPAKVHVVS